MNKVAHYEKQKWERDYANHSTSVRQKQKTDAAIRPQTQKSVAGELIASLLQTQRKSGRKLASKRDERVLKSTKPQPGFTAQLQAGSQIK